MQKPKGKPCATLTDSVNKLEILVFKSHGEYACYWRTTPSENWQRGPRHYKSVMGGFRAAYVLARKIY